MGSLSLTLREITQLTYFCSSVCSPRPWPPPKCILTMGCTGCTATHLTPCLATPLLATHGVGYPVSSYPGYPGSRVIYPGAVGAAGKSVVKFGTFLEINGVFERSGTLIVQGNFNIQQNGIFDLFSNGEAKFKAYIQSSRDLQGQNIMVELGTGATCAAAITASDALAPADRTNLATVNAPISFNGFYIAGNTAGHNINGERSKTTLSEAPMWLMIRDSTGVIGCSSAALT